VETRAAAAAQDCGGLANLRIESANLLSAAEVPGSDDLPAHCRVLGYVRPAINFEVRLPLPWNWNRNFYMTGCGGFCGTLDSDRPGFTNAMNYGLRRNYAVATTDAGHWGSSVVDGRWALSNPVAETDWGHRAVTETARVAKAIIRAYYGTGHGRAYFAGCSTGGRMAAVEASRYPNDFDGIIAGAPALDYTGLVATFFAWTTQANVGPDGHSRIFPVAKVGLVRDAVYRACDGTDGLKDELVSDPRRCEFRPASLQCRAGDNAADCLTAAEVGVLERWYAGPTNGRGERLYPGGIPLGSEPNWARWLTGTDAAAPLMPAFAEGFLRYMAFEPDAGASYRVVDFDFDRDPPRLATMAEVYNAATFEPGKPGGVSARDLSAFRGRGGKLLLYHGWGDPLVTPQLTVDYYEAVARAAGGVDHARNFARLFMVPGMDHCGINTDGPGIADTGIDPLAALEAWVERGQPPESLLTTKTDATGQTLWRRPVCAYPQTARYDGSGDPSDPASFHCSGP
jgi:feruloyl esterase